MSDEPLRPDVLDELLSADLDGELGAAAADLGVDPAVARRAVAAPDAAARRADLAATTDELDVPPLDEIARRRLLTAARGAGTTPARERAARAPTRRVGALTAAAGLLLLVGLAAVVVGGGNGDGGDETRAEGGAVPESVTESEAAESLEQRAVDVADPDALRSLLEETLPQASEAAPTDAPAAVPDDMSDAAPGGDDSSMADARTDADRLITCVDDFATAFAVPVERLIAVTFGGEPALVVVYASGGRAVVYDTDCAVVATGSTG